MNIFLFLFLTYIHLLSYDVTLLFLQEPGICRDLLTPFTSKLGLEVCTFIFIENLKINFYLKKTFLVIL